MIMSINGIDFSYLINSLKVGYETLVSEDSGRNAAGDTVIDVINKKIKLYVGFIPMFEDDMVKLLGSIEDYVVNVSYIDPKSKTMKTIQCYTGTPEPEYYNTSMGLYKQMSLNFIEL
jgi:5'-3' exonuclease